MSGEKLLWSGRKEHRAWLLHRPCTLEALVTGLTYMHTCHVAVFLTASQVCAEVDPVTVIPACLAYARARLAAMHCFSPKFCLGLQSLPPPPPPPLFCPTTEPQLDLEHCIGFS